MTKQQKIWLWIGLCLAFVPEILWSPVGNFIYSWTQPTVNGSVQLLRHNFLADSDITANVYSLILFFQSVGLLFVSIVAFKLSNKRVSRWVIGTVCALFSLFIFILVGLSISLRSIGF